MSFVLRPYLRGDAEYIKDWFASERAFYQWSSDRINVYPLTADALNAYYDGEDPSVILHMTMVDAADDIPAGHIILRYPDPDDRTHVRLGFVIVDIARRGAGLGRQLLTLAEDYARTNMGAKKLSLGVFENNPAACRCYKAFGFVECGGDWDWESPFGESWKCVELQKPLD